MTLFPSWNFFYSWFVVLSWRHWNYISLLQKPPPEVFCKKKCSYKYAGSATLKKRLWYLFWEDLRTTASAFTNLACWKAVCFSVNFIILMRIVNIVCFGKEGNLYATMLVSLLKLSEKVPKLSGRGIKCQCSRKG